MKFRFRLKLAHQLALSFGLMALLAAAMAGVGWGQIKVIQSHFESVVDRTLPTLSSLADAQDHLQRVRVAELEHLAALTMPEKDREEVKVKDAAKAFDAAVKTYLATSGDLADPKLVAQLKTRIAAFHEDRTRFFQMSNSAAGAEMERAQEAREYFNGEGMQAYMGADKAVRDLRAHHTHQADAAKALGAAALVSARQVLMAVGASIVLLSVVLATYITRRVTNQLGGEPGHVAYIAQRIANGDLCVPIPPTARGKANVMTAMEAMQGHLRELIGAVQQAADGILVGTREIADGNHDLSGRTEQQAISLQETTSSVSSIDETVRRGTDRAKETTAMTRQAFQSAEAGGATMKRVVETMSEISTKSQRVSDILGTIDGIATQTHILALNASVEAARAGTQGLGFAVVANEVRSLAHRCAEASREIRSLIGASVETVGVGTELVNAANADIARIVGQVRHIDQLVSEIHTTSTDQYDGIGRIRQTITTLEQTAHQNAALVEESYAAAALLTTQAQRLVAATSRFKVTEGEAEPLLAA